MTTFPTFVDVPDPANPPAGAEHADAAFLNALTGAVNALEAGARVAPAFGALRGALDNGASAGLYVLGDSTGNDTTEWVRLVTAALATDYPAHQVLYRLWDDGTQAYGAETQIQAGTGGERYLRIKAGNVGDFHSAITPGTGYVTGDLDVRVLVALDNWNNGTSSQLLAGCFGNSPARAWRLYVSTSGKLVLETTSDGTTLLAAFSTVNPAGVVNGAARWVRATIDVDNGAAGRTVTFYESADGITWTTVGTPVTNAGTTAINAPTGQPYEIGGRANVIDLAQGNYYRVEIRNGINGPTVAPVLADAWMPQNIRCYDLGGAPILYVVNGSQAGAGITYLGDVTRSPKMTPDYGPGVVLLSNSHNDLTRRGPSYLAEWDAWLTKLRVRYPAAVVGLVTQNPKRTGIDYALDHLHRRGHLMGWAAKNAIPVIDAMRAFRRDSRGIDALTLPDGIHPNPDGSQLWAGVVLAALSAA